LYDNLKKSLEFESFSYVSQITDFVHRYRNLYSDTIANLRELKKVAVKIEKDYYSKKNMTITDKAMKKGQKVLNDYKDLLNKCVENIRAIHTDLLYFSSILFLYQNEKRTMDEVDSTEYGTGIDGNLYLLSKYNNIYDSTDRESLITLNKLRNYICHSTYSSLKSFFNKEEIDDIIELIYYLSEMIKMIKNSDIAESLYYITTLNILKFSPYLLEPMLKDKTLLEKMFLNVLNEINVEKKLESLKNEL